MDKLNLNYWTILPEMIVATAGVVIMMIDAFSKNGGRKVNSIVALVASLLSLVSVFGLLKVGAGGYFSGMIVIDPVRIIFSIIILMASIIAILLSSQFLKDEGLPPGEFYSLMMFGTTGMLLLAGAGDLVTVFLGLETASITTYVLACYRRYDLRANESALKYFLLGSFSTAFLLYGMALVYGALRTTNIEQIKITLGDGQIQYPALLMIGAAMMIIGFGFKISGAPFHLWTPDVYEGAPTVVTGFMATGPKVAVFAAFLRIFADAFNTNGGGVTAQLQSSWITTIAIMAVITMTIGNVLALTQKNIKRMLAYSSIAHAGYILMGFVTRDYVPVAFYLFSYTLMTLGAFACIQLIARAGDRNTRIDDFAGIGFEVPAIGFPLAIFLFSLAGLPPTAGFMGKFYVFKNLWDTMPSLRYIVVIAVLNSIISIYYYLYPIVAMFFKPVAIDFIRPRMSSWTAVALIIALIGTLYIGILPNGLFKAMGSGANSAPAAVSLK